MATSPKPISSTLATVRSAMPTNTVTIQFRSQISPTISVDAAGRTTGESNGFSTWLMGLIRPTITVTTPAGDYNAAPYGVPTANYGLPLIVAGGVLGLSILGLAFILGKKSAS